MKVAIIGSGSWGVALGLAVYRAGNEVIIWSRNNDTVQEINNKHTNRVYLKDIILPENMKATKNIEDVFNVDAIMLTIPSQSIRELCEQLAHLNFPQNKIIIICAKGIEQKTLKLMSEIVEEVLPNNTVAVLSGPNFAIEVAKDLPAISSLASLDRELSMEMARVLSSNNFRVYPNQDVIGTQVIGATKNVLAIATGVAIGSNLGENAKSAIFSRGISEINRLIIAKGGKVDTMFSPAGIGDLNLTCSSATSRNTSFGISLAKGNKILGNELVEGYYTAESVHSLAKLYETDMPVMKAVYHLIYENQSLSQVIEDLLKRPLKYS